MLSALIILGILSAVLLSVLILFVRKNAALSARLDLSDELLDKNDARMRRLTEENEARNKELSSLRAMYATLQERYKASEEERKHAADEATRQFRLLAEDIFRSHTERFRESSEQRLGEILQPLKSNIDDFRKSVSEAMESEARERFSLRRELQGLMELNRTIGKEAKDLTRALKGDSKVQGDWGEMILERLLEMSGLREGVHYLTQPTKNTDGSKIQSPEGAPLRPDVVVLYPDDRCVVVDSKVSISAYAEMINAEDPGSPEAIAAGKRHLMSARNHINELARKNYQDLVGNKQLDFVLMFVPNEGAFMALMHLEPGLWEEAFAKRVLLTSPTHLISVLRMLAQLWRQDASRKNVAEIARLSGTMIDKITNFLGDLENVEKSLDGSLNACRQARRRLAEGNGNVLSTARRIVALGANPTRAERLSRIGTSDNGEDESQAIDSPEI